MSIQQLASTAPSGSKGSSWRKWDLQVQPIKGPWLCGLASKAPQIKEATRDFLKHAVTSGVSVVAITDHNCGHAIDAALSLVKDEGIAVTVLPGVEVDVNAGYQVLVIFNPQYKDRIGKSTWAETVDHFLNNVCGLPSPVLTQDGQAESIQLDIHQVMARVYTEDIGIPVFAHSQSDKGLFKQTTAANRKKFFENARDGKYQFAIDHKTEADLVATRKILEGWNIDAAGWALIKTSDAHNASEVGLCSTWIKSDCTYEGLKQIIYDPPSRVSTQDACPVAPTNVIESISFDVPKTATLTIQQQGGSEKDEPFCFAGMKASYELSPFFNCFVGGRGSGKSTVLNFLGQHSKDPSSSESFWERLQPSFDSADLAVFSFKGVELFEFVGQSEVESFATNKQAFTTAIYERANLRGDGLLTKHSERLTVILRRLDSFRSIVGAIEQLKKDYSLTEKERAVIQNSINVTKSAEYASIVAQITSKSNERQQLERWRTAIKELRESIGELRHEHFSITAADTPPPASGEADAATKYRAAFAAARDQLEAAWKRLELPQFAELVAKENELATEIESHEKSLSKLLKEAGLSEENILQTKSAPQRLVRLDDEVTKLKRKLGEANEQLAGYAEALKAAQDAKSAFEAAITDSIKPLVTALEEQAKENEKKDIKNIGLSYFFDADEAWKQIADEFYDFFAQSGGTERSDFLKSYLIEHKDTFGSGQSHIADLLGKEDKKTGYVKFLREVFATPSNFEIFQIIRDKHLNDVATYKRIQVLYDGKDIEQASFGQKCTAVMVILLLFGNYPLIIDEPEAHLDSSLIANYLVPLIKRQKSNRQIVFSTHNANFVVNGDAEKIFVLRNETGKTEVVEATIEDIEHRDELLKLEGGREAFRKRGEKLHI